MNKKELTWDLVLGILIVMFGYLSYLTFANPDFFLAKGLTEGQFEFVKFIFKGMFDVLFFTALIRRILLSKIVK